MMARAVIQRRSVQMLIAACIVTAAFIDLFEALTRIPPGHFGENYLRILSETAHNHFHANPQILPKSFHPIAKGSALPPILAFW